MTHLPTDPAAFDAQFGLLLRFAEVLCRTDLCPKAYAGKPQEAAIAMVMGHDLGLGKLQSLQSIAVINGNPSIYGDGALALVLASGLVETFEERGAHDALGAAEGDVERFHLQGLPVPRQRDPVQLASLGRGDEPALRVAGEADPGPLLAGDAVDGLDPEPGRCLGQVFRPRGLPVRGRGKGEDQGGRGEMFHGQPIPRRWRTRPATP